MFHHSAGGKNGVARSTDTSHGPRGTVAARHNARIHFQFSICVKYSATRRIKQRIVFKCHNSNGDSIEC